MASKLSNIAESGGFGLAGFGLSKLFDRGSKEATPNPFADFELPEFQEDIDFRETQDILKKFGTDLLSGDIPEFFSPIGETGGREFENYLSLLKGDVQESVESGFAATGRSGGVVGDVVGERVGRLSTEARFNDYLRALEGKERLLDRGIGVTQGVRGAGQTQQAQANAFELDVKNMDLRQRGLEFESGNVIEDRANAIAAAEGDVFGKILSTALNAGVGFATGGPAGALVGATSGFDFGSLLETKDALPNQKSPSLNLGQIQKRKFTV